MPAAISEFMALDDLWERPAPVSRRISVPVIGWLSTVDLVVAGVAILAVGFGAWLQASIAGAGPGPWWHQAISILTLGAILCVRRRFPLTQGALASVHLLVGSYLSPWVSSNFLAQVFYFVSIHAAVAWGRSRRAAWGVIAAIEMMLMGWVAVIFSRTNSAQQIMQAVAPHDGDTRAMVLVVVLYALINSAFVLGAAALGQVSWREARALSRATSQAATIAAQDSRLADQAVIAERLRIAREIHDSVSHHVSVIGIQAAGARRVMQTAPDRAREALVAVEEESRMAVAEMRSLLGSLRQDPVADPGLGDLAALCQEPHRARVSLDVVGDADRVAPSLGLTVYRIVQEALTNVEKHSGAAHAHVAVRVGAATAQVEVTDDGRGASARASSSPGVGLIGMSERVVAHRGILETGPRTTGGWRVLAHLPLVLAEEPRPMVREKMVRQKGETP